MSIEIFDCSQNSPEWFSARAGLPTASNFAAILARGEGKTRRSYLLRLAAEILTGEPGETFSNGPIERGHQMEEEARALYAFSRDVDPQIVGFIKNDGIIPGAIIGCSPDALLGENALLEIKSKRADLLIDILIKDEWPPEHRAQCQGALWVTEREYIDLVCYAPGIPLFVKRATRDESYIVRLAEAVEVFNFELQQTVKFIREYGAA